MRFHRLLSLAPILGLACASPPYEEPFEATVLQPAAGEALVVDQTVILFDSSGSINPEEEFPADKALFESFVAGMPEGSYKAGSVTFGGKGRQEASVGNFDRAKLAAHAKDAKYFGNDTPLEEILLGVADDLDGDGGQAAIILFTDGQPTVRGTPRSGAAELLAAQEIVDRHGGTVCFHVLQTGSAGDGAELLQQLTEVTDCGSMQDAASISSGSDLLTYQRAVYLGAGPPPVAAAPTDLDGDGVLDGNDSCPGTPRGANVDERGCWLMTTVRFAIDSAAINEIGDDEIAKVASVLADNPDIRIQVDGYTDSTGPLKYNEALSVRRADAVRDRLVADGIDASRLETRGFGPANPAASNDTPEGRDLNRRIEFSALD